MNSNLHKRNPLFVLIIISSFACADLQTGGHLKAQHIYTRYPENSIFQSEFGDSSNANQFDFRFNLGSTFDRQSAWDVNVDYQLLAAQGDTLNNIGTLTDTLINDDARLFDLTWTIDDDENHTVIHRLDRFNIGYTGEKLVLRFGRQALSWGNGLLFSIMDVVNPFDGRVYDQEYKTGDDMLYMQYLNDNGNDIQAASVFRRNVQNGETESDQNTVAGKYHGFLATFEYDFLLAQHYGDDLLALGLSSDLGGAVAHTELAHTATDYGDYISALAGLSYSWVAFAHNFSASLETYYNEMGLDEPTYSTLQTNPALLERVLRGENLLTGKHYIGASTRVEITPLFNASVNIFFNNRDQSALLQFTGTYDWQQNAQVFVAFSMPTGREGTEFRGMESEFEDLYLSREQQILVKLAWYY